MSQNEVLFGRFDESERSSPERNLDVALGRLMSAHVRFKKSASPSSYVVSFGDVITIPNLGRLRDALASQDGKRLLAARKDNPERIIGVYKSLAPSILRGIYAELSEGHREPFPGLIERLAQTVFEVSATSSNMMPVAGGTSIKALFNCLRIRESEGFVVIAQSVDRAKKLTIQHFNYLVDCSGQRENLINEYDGARESSGFMNDVLRYATDRYAWEISNLAEYAGYDADQPDLVRLVLAKQGHLQPS